ncbi:Insulin-like growth factor-binding protein complex acid labile subunit [Portunus trituberculatus]|uniref:Insulin-like growth factor-binding protein complex acid labile subunit n=1 Tax=Portunus trituberculatus TaxID=210409 RepID=A0A5B7ENU6_PORTR|nr:Insulin-like growth factor-binding protein complex acid labile subunit [Portunus trituberculatus]
MHGGIEQADVTVWSSQLLFEDCSIIWLIAKMEVLQKLEVSGSSFTTLPAFPYNPHLSSLFLDDNRINTIPPQIFSKLSNLMYLDLAYNSLYMLSEDSLNFSSQNVIAFLDHNAITYIDERTFSGQQPILLDVSYNHLKGLDQGVFQPVLDNIIDNDDDSYVDATNNPLQCPSISWVLEDSLYLYFLALPEPPCTPARVLKSDVSHYSDAPQLAAPHDCYRLPCHLFRINDDDDEDDDDDNDDDDNE